MNRIQQFFLLLRYYRKLLPDAPGTLLDKAVYHIVHKINIRGSTCSRLREHIVHYPLHVGGYSLKHIVRFVDSLFRNCLSIPCEQIPCKPSINAPVNRIHTQIGRTLVKRPF